MSILAIIAALLFDHIKPFDRQYYIGCPLENAAHRINQLFNANDYHQGIVAWLLAVLPITLAFAVLWVLLYWAFPLLAWLLNVAIVYFLIDFQRKNNQLASIISAFERDDIAQAKRELAQWIHLDVGTLTREEVISQTIKAMLKSSISVIFAPVFWFVLLPGPTGIIVYCLSTFFAQHWVQQSIKEADAGFSTFSIQVVRLLDWLPIYILSGTFALVGNFVDVVYAMRIQRDLVRQDRFAPVYSSGTAAIGVRCSNKTPDGEIITYGLKETPNIHHLSLLFTLLWRALVAWLAIFGLISFVF